MEMFRVKKSEEKAQFIWWASSRKQFRCKKYYGKMPKGMEPILSEKTISTQR